jgi:hypothetical protein
VQNTFTNRTATWFALIGTIILIGLSSWVFTISARMPESQPWVLMALVDILVVVPLIWYMVVLRPRGMRPLALIPLFVVSCGVAWLLLPSAYQSWLAPIWIVLPLLELVMMGVLIVRLRRIVAWYRAHRHEHPYVVDALIASVSSELGSSLAVRLFVLETLMIYLSFVGWFLRYRQVQPQHQIFFYHQKSRYTPVFMAWMSVMLIETVLFHLLIQGWNETVAWVITGISVYSCFWLAGEYTLIKLSPHVLDGTTLYLRSGLRWRTQITLSEIVAVEKPKRADAKSPDYVAFARSDEPQMVLCLAHPVRVDGLFGTHKTVRRIGIFVDDLVRFQQVLGIDKTDRRYLV